MLAEFQDADDLLARAERSNHSASGEVLANLQLVVASVNQEFEAIVASKTAWNGRSKAISEVGCGSY